MSDGFYLMHRGWLENPALDGDAYCRRAAWAWLIDRARWQEGAVRALGKTVSLNRGQLTFALRYLASAWGWSEAKVRRFLKTLQEHGMVSICSELGQVVITVCNYDDYQLGVCNGDAGMTQDRRGSDANKNKPLREESSVIAQVTQEPDPSASHPVPGQPSLRPPALAPQPADDTHIQGSLLPSANVVAINNSETRFAAFYAAYPRKVKRKEARVAYVKALKIATHEQIMDGLRRFQFSAELKWRPHPASWLNGERWLDEVDTDPRPTATTKPSTDPAADPFGVQAWAKALPGVRPTESAAEREWGNWKNADGCVDFWALRICQEAGFKTEDRPDLSLILSWMKSGLGPEEAAKIVADKMAWWQKTDGGKITSLRFFDEAFRRRGVA